MRRHPTEREIYDKALRCIAKGNTEKAERLIRELEKKGRRKILRDQLAFSAQVRTLLDRGKYGKAKRMIEDGLIGPVRKRYRSVLDDRLLQIIPLRVASGRSIEKPLKLLSKKLRTRFEEADPAIGGHGGGSDDEVADEGLAEVTPVVMEATDGQVEEEAAAAVGSEADMPGVLSHAACEEQASTEVDDAIAPFVGAEERMEYATEFDIDEALVTIDEIRKEKHFNKKKPRGLGNTEREFIRILLERWQEGNRTPLPIDDLASALSVGLSRARKLVTDIRTIVLRDTAWQLIGDYKVGVSIMPARNGEP
jgi:hypothetical protein